MKAACVLCIGLLLSVSTWAQLHAPLPVPSAGPPDVAKDSLGRTTPKGTVYRFLIAARAGDDELAAQYLNTRYGGKAAAGLAHELFIVLDRRLPPRLNEISDKPEGSLSYPPLGGRELVGTISGENGNVDIMLERVDRGNSGSLWLFSDESLDSIPDLYKESIATPVENVLPEFLVTIRFAGIPLFEWLIIFVGLPLFFFLMIRLNRLLSPFIGVLARRLKPDLRNPEFLPKPVRLLLLALVIRWIISRVSLPLLARQFWSGTTTILTVTACVWLLLLSNKWAAEHMHRVFRNRNITGTSSMPRLARRAMDLLVIFVGVLVILRHFRVNPTAELAGFGVGGIAVAFAAQRTLENVIGGVSLIFDKAVRVGDQIKLGNTQGTVEDIGLRATRIRTLDRTTMSVPNAHIAILGLENLSSRDKFWFHQDLALRYGTTTPQMHGILDDIRILLEESQQVEPASICVRFLRFGPSSLEVKITAYISALDWSEFLTIQERLLFRIMNCLESSGVQIAFPFQTLFVPASNSSVAGAQSLTSMPMSDAKPTEHK
jgi:MscS family membrane protein